ncbi:hypothetical protein CEXT_13101 [Caerostris extrusa]|uniref:Uncharacterized protein n=1 Tax=Caerostris extrusa TaxID=172846 RepID=A0AAV4V9X5_CAEEX|nr:hypothetical protein CEXT_13101 [Caerostris extrusa]
MGTAYLEFRWSRPNESKQFRTALPRLQMSKEKKDQVVAKDSAGGDDVAALHPNEERYRYDVTGLCYNCDLWCHINADTSYLKEGIAV